MESEKLNMGRQYKIWGGDIFLFKLFQLDKTENNTDVPIVHK